jgi:PGF-CTERM protein
MTMKSKPSRAAISASILVCLLVLVSIVPLGAVAQSGGETEPNDARAAATPIEDSVSGEITVKGGVDWYSAKFNKGETVSFLVTKSINEPDLEITLYGPNGEQLDADSSGAPDRRMQVATNTANYTGMYYIKVKAYTTSKTGIPYVVQPNSQTAATRSAHNEGEPNDARGAATSLQKESVRGVLSGAGDTDWYSAEFTRGELVSFMITDKEVGVSETNVMLYSPNGTRLKDKYMNENDTRIQVATTAKQKGTYHLKVIMYTNEKVDSSLAYSIRLPDQTAPPKTSLSTTTDTATSTQTETLSSTQTTASNTDTAATTTTSTGTETSAQTETGSSETGTTASANTPAEEETTSMFGPGFTSVGAIIALLSAGLFAFRRR